MPNTIIPKKSSVAGKVPLTGDLQAGEIAFNLADQRIYSKNGAGTVIEMAVSDIDRVFNDWSGGTATTTFFDLTLDLGSATL